MPRTKIGRIQADYGKSISNIKECVRTVLENIFSYDFVMERIKVAPSILEFSTEETDSAKRKIEIHKRLAKEDQHLPIVVISEFHGSFSTGQIGAGPSESYSDPITSTKWLGYSTVCTDGAQSLDIFAEDPDTRDALGDALSAGFLLYMRDTFYTVFKVFDHGKYQVCFDSSLTRSPGSDLERDNDPEIKIVNESIELKLASYDETVYVEAVPERAYTDAEALGLNGLQPVYDVEQQVQIQTNVCPGLQTGKPFQIRISGGSGFFQYYSSDPCANVDPRGVIMPIKPGTSTLVIYDSINKRAFELPVTVA